MHRSSQAHRAWPTPCRPVRLPGPTDPAGPPMSPIDSGTASETPLRALSEIPGMPQNLQPMPALPALGPQRVAPRNAHCRFCRCSGDSARRPPVPEGANASMACQDFPRSAANAIPFTVQLGGSHCLRCMRCRAGRKAFRALWKLRRILLRPLATLAIASIVQVRERGHLRSIESPWRQQCPKPLFRTCSVDAASAA